MSPASHPLLTRFDRVTDYRTWVSGVTAGHLVGAPLFTTVQAEVASLLRGRTVVGHALKNDFNGAWCALRPSTRLFTALFCTPQR